MNFKSILLCLLFLTTSPLLAHEFWLEPQQFIFSAGDEINIRFKVGEGFYGNNWEGNRQKVQELKLYFADVVDDLSDGLSEEAGDSLQFSMFNEGTLTLTFNNVNSYIELDAQKFNEYLQEYGLTSAIEYRKAYNETDSAGREFYQRSVKTIVQVGSVKTDVFKKQTSLPVDIIPLSNPYSLSNNETLRVKVLFKGSPLANRKVRVWHKIPGYVKNSTYTSNENGEILFPVSTTGEWMVSCVNMICLEDTPNTKWQSYWGSCTWGYTGSNVWNPRSR